MAESQIIGRECLWRYTAETPKVFGILDARAMLPFVIMAFHLRLWTFELACVGTAIFFVLGLFRITPIEGTKAVWFWVLTLGYRNGYYGHRRIRQ